MGTFASCPGQRWVYKGRTSRLSLLCLNGVLLRAVCTLFRPNGFSSFMRHDRSLNPGQYDKFSSIYPSGLSFNRPKMLPCLRRVLRPALSLRAGSRFTTSGLIYQQAPVAAAAPWLVHRCHMGTHPLKESVEPLNSPRGAKEFIYSLHPSERTCLLRELHRFESIAIAQGRSESIL